MTTFKGRVSNFWKPILIFEILKANTPLPQKSFAPILIDPPHIYVAYAIQATIGSVKHKALFHQNYLQNYFFPQTCGCLSFHQGLSTEKIRQIVCGCFSIPSTQISDLHPQKFRFNELDYVSLVILQTAAYLITSVSSPRLLQSSSLPNTTASFRFHLNILIAAKM